MNQSLLVDRSLDATVAEDKRCLHSQVACSEHRSPNLTIADIFPTLSRVEIGRLIRTSEPKTIDGNSGGGN